MNIPNISIALVVGSSFNNSTERSMNEMHSYFRSIGFNAQLFLPDISYFHSYLFNFIRLFGLNVDNFYTSPTMMRFAYIFIKLYSFISKSKFNKFLFDHRPNFFKSYKKLDLSNFDYIITHCPYLLPFLISKSQPLLTINADYFHQERVSLNRDWWTFCIKTLSKHQATLFTNSTELACIFKSMGYPIKGVIPDGPTYNNLNFTSKKNRNFLLIYGHTSRDKGFNYLNSESLLYLKRLRLGQISLLGTSLIKNSPFRFHNYGALPYLNYLLTFRDYKFFLYPSNSDSFESPPIDALLSGCIVISSKTPAALHYSKFTKRIILLDSISKVDIERALTTALSIYSDLTKSEYDYLLYVARQHSAIEGAKNYLNFIKSENILPSLM